MSTPIPGSAHDARYGLAPEEVTRAATPGSPGDGIDTSSAAFSRAGALLDGRFGDEVIAQYEQLTSRLLMAGEAGPFAVAVTSSVAGEGVSSVCVGLALSLARSTTKSIALVDANLRRPSLHDVFGLPSHPGLHELIEQSESGWRPDGEQGESGIRAYRTPVSNLWLVPSGAPASHPAQLLTSEGAKAQVRRLHSYFNFVVIDCPPVLHSVEAACICRMASGVAMVVRQRLIPREDVRRAQELLQGAPLLGAVLTGTA